MDKIYDNFSDVHVSVRKVYTKASDTYAYADKKCTVTIKPEDLQDAFYKGVIIVDVSGNEYEYTPVKCVLAAGVVTLTYLTVTVSDSSTTIAAATVESKA